MYQTPQFLPAEEVGHVQEVEGACRNPRGVFALRDAENRVLHQVCRNDPHCDKKQASVEQGAQSRKAGQQQKQPDLIGKEALGGSPTIK